MAMQIKMIAEIVTNLIIQSISDSFHFKLEATIPTKIGVASITAL